MIIKKRRWLTFMLAIVPGVGHLYLGYKRQGLQFMLGASACIIFIPAVPMVFPFALAALWFYQMFDALQKATWLRMTALEHERHMMHPDGFGAPWNYDPYMMPGVPRDEVKPAWVGGACVLAGVLVLVTTLFPDLWEFLLEENVGTALLAIGLIGYGLHLLRRNGKHTGF